MRFWHAVTYLLIYTTQRSFFYPIPSRCLVPPEYNLYKLERRFLQLQKNQVCAD